MSVGVSQHEHLPAPAIILVAIALNQVRLVFTRDLVPWKGGGFAMFATVDSLSARSLRAYAVGPAAGEEVRLQSRGFSPRTRPLAYPTDERLASYGEWMRRTAQRRLPGAVAVRVEVWRVDYDIETSTHVAHKLREYVHELGDDEP